MTNANEARLVQNNDAANTGIYFLDAGFSRGWSYKMAKSAEVIVHDPHMTESWTNVLQMVGRGCRSLGRQNGYYAMLGDDEEMDVEKLLLSKFDETHHDFAPIFIRALQNIGAGNWNIKLKSMVETFFRDKFW